MTFTESKSDILPENPCDGWVVVEQLADGGNVVYTYSEQFNQWTYQVNSEQIQGYIEPEQILGIAEMKVRIDELEKQVKRLTNEQA